MIEYEYHDPPPCVMEKNPTKETIDEIHLFDEWGKCQICYWTRKQILADPELKPWDASLRELFEKDENTP